MRRQQILDLLRAANIQATDGERNIKVCCPMAPYSGMHSKLQDSRPSMGILYADYGPLKVNCFTCGYRSLSLSRMFEDLFYNSKDEFYLQFIDKAVLIEELGLDDILSLADTVSYRKKQVDDPVIDDRLYSSYRGIYHPYWDERGITGETARVWEAGFDSELGRVTIPVRCARGKLRGATGRATQSHVRPKYHNYWDMKKGRWLLGEHLVKGSSLVLVEGPFDAVLAYQHLQKADLLHQYSVLSLMGANITPKQENTLVRLGSDIVLFLDRDDAGLEGTHKISNRLSRRCIVSSVRWGSRKEKDPAELSAEAFVSLIESATYLGTM